MRAAGTLLGGGDDAYLAAGVLISAAALAVACVYLARLVALDRDAPTAQRSVVYLLVFPTSVFLAAGYAGALFLPPGVGARYEGRPRRWPLPPAALGVGGWRVLRPGLAAYATTFFLASLLTGTLTSAPRYSLAVFPAFITLAIAAPRPVALSYVALGTAASVLFTAMFALRYWVA